MLRIHINVSRYDNGNADMVRIKSAAENNSDWWEVLRDCNEEFFSPAMNFWIERFRHRNDVKFVGGHPQIMWGVFGGVSDPSICVELDAEPDALRELKLATIDFGEQANQSNVHICKSLGHAANQTFGPLLDEHGTLEIAWLVTFRTLSDPRKIHAIANRIGIKDLSVKCDGLNILIYTFGNQIRKLPGIPEQYKRLARELGISNPQVGKREFPQTEQLEMSVKKDNMWCMELINFGSKRNGATHTYKEARRVLGG